MKHLFNLLMGIAALGLLRSQAATAATATVSMLQTNGNYNYTISNNDPTNSANYLNAFHLVVNAHVTVTSSPAGWVFETDNSTYVDWFCTDTNVPYAHFVAPGAQMSGFIIESPATNSEPAWYGLAAWNVSASNSVPGYDGAVASPSIGGVRPVELDPGYLPGNVFQFTLVGAPTHYYVIESSSDWVNWSDVATNLSPFIYVETNWAGFSQRFYRSSFEPSAANAIVDDGTVDDE